jgi:hypothetical protein
MKFVLIGILCSFFLYLFYSYVDFFHPRAKALGLLIRCLFWACLGGSIGGGLAAWIFF